MRSGVKKKNQGVEISQTCESKILTVTTDQVRRSFFTLRGWIGRDLGLSISKGRGFSQNKLVAKSSTTFEFTKKRPSSRYGVFVNQWGEFSLPGWRLPLPNVLRNFPRRRAPRPQRARGRQLQHPPPRRIGAIETGVHREGRRQNQTADRRLGRDLPGECPAGNVT